ncbi:hypothetical protein [Bradyrhizobium neotropicale]|uniref:hypothetical protein n=1 Tax=Bradyrhizobium neotropicale TaxID=1497615 RepID=UPI001AD7551B|nr:hypothetical protein [Bradyrhizobium neotropicale]
MPTVIRIRSSAPLSRDPRNLANAEFAPVALFCGIGLFVSFVAVIFDAQGVWH